MSTFKEKFRDLQQEIGAIKRDSENPFYKSKYFDINSLIRELLPLLKKHGLILFQPLGHLDGKTTLTTELKEVDGDGSVDSTCILPENNDPQKMGSIITYFRRYSIQSLLLLHSEDDDGNSVAQENREVEQWKKSKTADLPISTNTAH